jgi:hypothetical protein
MVVVAVCNVRDRQTELYKMVDFGLQAVKVQHCRLYYAHNGPVYMHISSPQGYILITEG